MSSKVRGRPNKQGARIKSAEPVDYDRRPPTFSLEKIQPGKYCLSNLDQKNKAMFADAIFRRKGLAWNEIKRIPRHGLGTEKIPKSAIKAPIPRFITEDSESFLVFRYNGQQPMVGYRVKDIFYVLWFDHDFSLYDH